MLRKNEESQKSKKVQFIKIIFLYLPGKVHNERKKTVVQIGFTRDTISNLPRSLKITQIPEVMLGFSI